MRPRDWVVIGVGWVGLTALSVRPLVDTFARETGISIDVHDLAIGKFIEMALWLALTPVLFGAIDRIRLRVRALLWQAAVCVALFLAIGAVHGAADWSLIHGIGPYVVHDRRILATDVVRLDAQIADAFAGLPLSVVVYIVLCYVVRRRERDRVGAEAAAALRAATLHALAIELQPHFLFNTLNAIAALTRTDPRTAERMIVHLSDLLRLTLDAGARGEHSLADELDQLDRYLALQQMRFGDRLTVQRQIEEGLHDVLVPTMLLQPLVENALAHGIGPKRGPGLLGVEARRTGESLELIVRDDGVGLTTDTPGHEGRGLGNTRQRLALLHQDAAELTVAPLPAGGTIARVWLPVRRAPVGRIDASMPRREVVEAAP
jgi:hypothetical protein